MKIAYTLFTCIALLGISIVGSGCYETGRFGDKNHDGEYISNEDSGFWKTWKRLFEKEKEKKTTVDVKRKPLVLGQSLAALSTSSSCQDISKLLKDNFVTDMQKTIDQNLQSALSNFEYYQQYGCYNNYYYEDSADYDSGSPAPQSTSNKSDSSNSSAGTTETTTSEAKDYSTTNTQVVGVDEADFIKNDGKYIYILADNVFQILEAFPAETAKKISTTTVEGTPKKLFVNNNKALIYSALGYIGQPDQEMYYDDSYYSSECTYGYDCEFTGDNRKLKITILDITDKTTPEILREITLNGSYLNSRRINDIAYSVILFPEISVNIPYSQYPEELGWDLCQWNESKQEYELTVTKTEIETLFADLKKENEQLIRSATITDFLPSVKDIRHGANGDTEENGLLQDCNSIFISKAGKNQNLLSVISFDIDDQGTIGATTILTKPGAVYASANALYVATRQYQYENADWFYDESQNISESTTIHKFSFILNDIHTTYAGSGFVKGHVLNQFAMDEHNGFLRIATTLGHVPDPNVHSTISILKESDGLLSIEGQIDNIAPTEDIRSARFDGDQGYIVTFKKTDPLFVLDLSNPQAPNIKGELKIPGFSTYMQMMDDSHILSIGYDADDQGNFAWFQGIQLQIMDVSDLANPKLVHKEIIGTRGSTSDAATNHFAFNYFKKKDLLAIPMTICEGGSGGSYGDLMSFSGLMVYKVTTQNGFQLLGKLAHEEQETQDNYWGACGNWWTQSNSKVKRSIFMDDYVYSVAMDKINISALSNIENPVASITLSSGNSSSQTQMVP